MTFNRHSEVSKNEHCFSTIPNFKLEPKARPLLRVLCFASFAFLIPRNSSAKCLT